MDERNSQYELQRSRNGLTVPVINGVFLHSIYNPVKEAEAFIESQLENLKYKNKILILGLGFGYHVEEVEKKLESFHKEYEIIVLEPNKRLIEDYIASTPIGKRNIKIISKEKVKELFNDWNFISYLMQKPCIIKHDASFVINRDFYTKFLAYQAPKDIINFKSILNETSESFFSKDVGKTFDSYVDSIKEGSHVESKESFMLLALNEIKKLDYQGK